MRLTAIVPIYGFDSNRVEALKHLVNSILEQDLVEYDENSQPTKNKNYEVIFIEQNCHPNNNPIKRHYLHNLPENCKWIVLPYQEKGFNKAWCMNVAARKASCNELLFLDADTLFDKNYFERIANFHEQNNYKFFLGWKFIIGMPGKDAPTARIIETTILTAGGSFFIDRHFYWDIGGMCENYYGYGGEDNDFWLRANYTLGDREKNNIPNMDYALLHWYHDWAVPSPDRHYFLNRTKDHTQIIISRLKQMTLGSPLKPKEILFSDLP